MKKHYINLIVIKIRMLSYGELANHVPTFCMLDSFRLVVADVP